MTGARALLRLAWRDARRDRWRTVLVIVLVALPVALLGGAITSFDTMTALPEERATDQMGRADAIVRLGIHEPDLGTPSPAELRADLADQLPQGATIEAHTAVEDEVILPGQRLRAFLTDIPLEDGLGVGRYRLHAGRAPTGSGEVALTESLADRLDVGVGDRLSLAAWGDVEVVGIARRPQYLLDEAVLVPPSVLSADGTPFDVEEVVASLYLLVGLPAGTGDATGNPAGGVDVDSFSVGPLAELSEGEPGAVGEWYVVTRDEVLRSRFGEGERWTAVIVGGLAVVEVALIVGAAFAVSVRRRQRELGLLAAVGGTSRHVRRTVLLTGGVAGVVGAVIGTVLGLSIAFTAFPWFETLTNREVTSLRLDPLWLVAVAAVGVGSTLIGAWWPARAVARLPVTVALSGRRPAPQPSVRGLRVGLITVVAAIAVLALAVVTRVNNPYVFLLGSVLLVLGVGLTSPWLLEQLGRLAPRLPVGPRLALRDAARFRTRNGPIVTAAMAGLAGSIAIATVVTSLDRHEAENHWPHLGVDQVLLGGNEGPAVAQQVVAEFGGQAASITLTDAGIQPVGAASDGSDQILGMTTIGDPQLAEVLGGREAVAALERGEVVVLGHDVDVVEVFRWESGVGTGPAPGDDPLQTVLGTYPARQLPLPEGVRPGFSMLPSVLLPQELADEVTDHGEMGLVQLPFSVDDETHERIVTMAAEAPSEVYVMTERGYRSPYATMLATVLTVGAVTGLALVGIAIALAAAEARGDLRTLTAVGADRRTRRSLAAGRALLLSGLGGVLAIPVGLIPGMAVLMRMAYVDLAVPWVAVMVAALAVPVLATAGAALASRRDPGPSLRIVA